MAANKLLTIDMITREAARLFRNTNAFLGIVDMQYDDEFGVAGAKIGDSVRIRLPVDYTVGSGPVITPQPTNETNTTLTLSNQSNVPTAFTELDLALSIDDFNRRFNVPAMNNLAGAVATNVIEVTEKACNAVAKFDTNGNVIQPDPQTILRAGARLTNNGAPKNDRSIVLDPIAQADAVAQLAGLFNPQIKISAQYRTGMLSKDTLGFDFYEDQTVIKHTTGTATGITVNGAGQTGNTLAVSALTGTLNVGDIFTIAGVYAVNRITKQTTGELQQFVVTQAAVAGDTALSVYPSIIPPNADGSQVQYQTVTAAPANAAPLTPFLPAGQTFRKNFALYKEAVTVASARLRLPKTGVIESAFSKYKGFGIAYVRGFDILNYQEIGRIDCVYGAQMVRPEWCCAIYSPL